MDLAHTKCGLMTLMHKPLLKFQQQYPDWNQATPQVSKWFDGIGEYVLNWGPGYRIYLAKDGDTLIILFGGGTKSKQQKDINKAKNLHTEYKQRKKTK